MKTRVLSVALLLLAAVISQGSAQDKCGLITMASELGNVTMPSDVGIIANALSPGGDNPENPFIQIRDFQITCAVADTEPDTYQFLSVVVSLTCEGTAVCVASQLGGEGNFTSQFELQCSSGEWVLGDDTSAAAADTFTDPADGTLTTPTNRQCGLCYSNQQAASQLNMNVISYDNITHCASCDSSCQSEGAGLCTNLGAGACCSFYHDAGSGFMCVDMCPPGFSPNATFFCQIPADCGALTIDDGTVTYNQATSGRGDTELGAVATYECNELFALSGNANRTCQENSDWSGTDPTCEACSENCLECFYSDSMVTTVCTTCTVGFALRNGACIADCGALTIDDGTVTYNQATAGRGDTELGAVAIYECNELFVLKGNANRTCQANSDWSGTDPMCVISCPIPSSPENGDFYVSDSTLVLDSVVIFFCDDGFLINGTRKQTCEANGMLSGPEPPTCVEDTTEIDIGGFGGVEIALIVCAIVIFLILLVVLLVFLLCGAYFKSKE